MHILIITPGFPADENDTDCIPPMQVFFKYFQKNYPEIKITVVSIHYPFKRNSYKWYEIPVHACGAKNKKQPLRLFYWFRALNYSMKINKKLKVDIVHSFWFNESALVGRIVSKFLGVKHINSFMGQDVLAGNKYLKIISIKNIYTVAVSQRQAKFFKKTSGKDINEIIPWGIEESIPPEEETKHEIFSRDIDVLGVGSLIPVKNYKLFISIISKIIIEFPSLKCLIVGDGKERKMLEKQITNSGLQKNIELTGHLSREEVLFRMQKTKIFLHTSNYESFGFVIAEALASGCFVVCKETGCAVPNEKLLIAKTEGEFQKILKMLLKSELTYKPLIPYPLSDTLNSYYKLYTSRI
jgi:1,2-diacylglycerol 3-alpha-glucosyltransferase